jgi:cytidyltransferase-like protein
METIAIYPGRFHPFHKGHASSWKQLADEFGRNNTYVAISQKQEAPKSPFSAEDRAKMAMISGIPKENIISVANPYGGTEYIERFRKAGIDPEKTILVFGVSKKDMETDPRFTFQPKKDGSAAYMQPYKKGSHAPMTQHAYVVATDVADFPIAGQSMRDASAIRKEYAGASDEKKLEILTDLYGDKGKLLKSVFDEKLTQTTAPELIKQIKPKLKTASPKQKEKFAELLEAYLNKHAKPISPNNSINSDYLPEK